MVLVGSPTTEKQVENGNTPEVHLIYIVKTANLEK
jgi:hypothetical protein